MSNNRCSSTDMNNMSLFQMGISCAEIEKSKAIKSKRNPLPYAIKLHLGNCLGDAVIESIPDYITRQNEEVELNDRLQRLEAFGNKNLGLAFTKNNPTLLGLQKIIRIGVDKMSYSVGWEDSLIDELVNYDYTRTVEINCELEKELLKCICAAEHELRIEIDGVMNEFSKKFNETKKLIEIPIKNEFEKKLRRQSIRFRRDQDKTLKTKIIGRKKELKSAFCYHMMLVRSELYEKFQNEKFENQLRWGKALEEQKEIHCRNLKHLRASLEAEHVQNQTELEHYYEVQDRPESVVIDDQQQSSDHNEVDKTAIYDAKINEKDKELLMHKKILEYVLKGYIDFIENSFKKQPQILPKEHLFQVKSLMAKIKNAEIENHKGREQTPCANNVICIEQKTSFEL